MKVLYSFDANLVIHLKNVRSKNKCLLGANLTLCARTRVLTAMCVLC